MNTFLDVIFMFQFFIKDILTNFKQVTLLKAQKLGTRVALKLVFLLQGLIEHDLFHRSLFACCLEIIIFSYNSQR